MMRVLTCSQEDRFSFGGVESQSILQEPTVQGSKTTLETRNIRRITRGSERDEELCIISILIQVNIMSGGEMRYGTNIDCEKKKSKYRALRHTVAVGKGRG